MIRLVAGVTLVAAAGAAGSRQEPYSDDWKRLRSGTFTAVGNASYQHTRAVLLELEGFHKVFHRSLAATHARPETPTTIVVFRDDRSFAPFKPKNDRGQTRSSIAGYFLSTAGGNYMAVAIHPDLRRTFQHLFHEYTHAVVRQNLRDLPEWLSEGLAEFYSTLQADPRARRSILGQPSPGRLQTLRSGPLLPWRDVLTYTAGATLTEPPGKVAAFYAQAWALVHHLELSRGGRGRPEWIDAYLQQVRAGATADGALSRVFGVPWPELEAALAAYIRQPAFPQVSIEDDGAGQIRTTMEAMRQSDVDALHATLREALGRMGPPHRVHAVQPNVMNMLGLARRGSGPLRGLTPSYKEAQ